MSRRTESRSLSDCSANRPFELYHDLMRRPLVRVLDWQACDDVVPEHEGNVGDQLQAAAQRGKNRIGTEVGSNSTAVTPSCCR